MLRLPAISNGFEQVGRSWEKEQKPFFLCKWIFNFVDEIRGWLVKFDETPINSIPSSVAPRTCRVKVRVSIYCITWCIHLNTCIQHTLSPQFSTLLTASQNGSYSSSPDKLAHGNYAYGNCSLLKRLRTMNTTMVFTSWGAAGLSSARPFSNFTKCSLMSPRFAKSTIAVYQTQDPRECAFRPVRESYTSLILGTNQLLLLSWAFHQLQWRIQLWLAHSAYSP